MQGSDQQNNSKPLTPQAHAWLGQFLDKVEANPQQLLNNQQDFTKATGYTQELCKMFLEASADWPLEDWLQFAQQNKEAILSTYQNFQKLANQGIVEIQNLLPGIKQAVLSVTSLVDTIKWRIQWQAKERQRQKEFEDQRKEVEELKEYYVSLERQYKSLIQQLHNKQGDLRVLVKIRPIILEQAKDEKERNEMKDVMVRWKSISQIIVSDISGIFERQHQASYKVDQVLHPNASQVQVFEEIHYLVHNMFDGKKGAVLCSGQAGSGKTYTMFGSNEWKQSLSVTQGSGIVIRVLELIFATIDKERKKGRNLVASMKFKEFYVDYPEEPNNNKSEIKFSSKKPTNLITTEPQCFMKSFQDCLALLKRRLKDRRVAKTQESEQSSRSHLVLSIQLYQNEQKMMNAQISLLDLAGNQKLNSRPQQQSIYINSSLFELNDCLRSIKRGGQDKQRWKGSLLVEHLRPYLEDSKSILITTISSKRVDERAIKASMSLVLQIMHSRK